MTGRLAKVLLALSVLAALLAGGFVLFAGRLARANKDQLVAAAAAALGREVAVHDIGASLWGGLALTLDGVQVADDPAFSAEPLVTVERVALQVRLLPLLRREIAVRRLVLQRPRVTLVRDARGRLNVAALGRPAARVGAPAPPPPAREAPAPGTGAGPAAADGAPAVGAREVTIEDASLAFVDRTRPDGAIRAEGIDITARALAADGTAGAVRLHVDTVSGLPVAVADLAAELRLVPNGADASALRLRLGDSEVRGTAAVTSFTPLRVRYALESGRLDLGPLLGGGGGDGARRGPLVEDLHAEGIVGGAAGGDDALAVGTTARAARCRLGDVDLAALALTAVWRPLRTTIESLSLTAYGGSLATRGSVETPADAPPRFTLDSQVQDLDVQGLLRAAQPGRRPPLRGTLDATFAGSGVAGPAPARTLRGEGRVELRDGALLDTNLAEAVLGGVTGVPGITTLINERTRRKFPDLFGSEDTVFRTLRSTVGIDRGVLRLTDLVISATDYDITGAGTVTLALDTAMNATLRLGTKLSDDLLSERGAARTLRDPDGRISIPFELSGVAPRLQPRPDLRALAGRATEGGVREAIDEALERLLPGARHEEGGKKKRRRLW